MEQTTTENDTIILKKTFTHKTFEERMAEYENNITICNFNWNEPLTEKTSP